MATVKRLRAQLEDFHLAVTMKQRSNRVTLLSLSLRLPTCNIAMIVHASNGCCTFKSKIKYRRVFCKF